MTFQIKAKLALTLCLLLLTIVACQRTSQPQISDSTSASNNLETTSTEAQEAWLPALMSEYLQNDELTLSMSVVSATVNEADGTMELTINRTGSLADPLTVNLLSSDTSELVLDATVVIPANSSEITTTVTILNDNEVDGNQTVVLSASAVDYAASEVTLTVFDVPALSLVTSSSSVSETDGTIELTISRTGSLTNPLTVNLLSSDTSELVLDATVVIPANASEITTTVTIVNDYVSDGNQTVLLSATALGYIASDATLSVLDISPTLTLTTASTSVSELDGVLSLTVERSSSLLTNPLTVSLTSSDVSEITVPASITIPAGQASITFDASIVEEFLADNNSVAVSVTTDATGYTASSVSVNVLAPSCGDSTISVVGDQTLVTQADVNALAGVSVINGNLVINPSGNLDFSPLYLLTEIAGNFNITNTSGLTSVSGFNCLSDITNGFNVSNNLDLTEVFGFEKLETIAGLLAFADNDFLTNIPEFEGLKDIRGLRISSNPNLTRIPPFVALITNRSSIRIIQNNSITSVSGFLNLESTTGISLYGNNSLITISGFNALKSIGKNGDSFFDGFEIRQHPKLESISGFGVLTRVDGQFYVHYQPVLESISGFEALESIGHRFYINNFGANKLVSIPNFSALKTVGDEFRLDATSLQTISGFPMLERVRDDFSISSNPNLSSISGFNLLTSIKIIGSSTVQRNALLDCTNPVPAFAPVDTSTSNLVNCN